MTLPNSVQTGDPGHVEHHNAIKALLDERITAATASATHATVVEHGATTATARPAGAVLVQWVGSVAPTNAATDDLWLDTSTAPATLKRHNGTAFESLGGSGGGASTTTVFVGAGQIDVLFGASTFATTGPTTLSRVAVWTFDAASDEVCGATVALPTDWTSVHVDLLWTQAGAANGDVVWQYGDQHALTDGVTLSNTAQPNVVAAAPAADVVEVTRVATSRAHTAGSPLRFHAYRVAGNASDTFTADALLIGVQFTKA